MVATAGLSYGRLGELMRQPGNQPSSRIRRDGLTLAAEMATLAVASPSPDVSRAQRWEVSHEVI